MQLNTVTQYNNTFMSPNSALPICGHNLRDAYVNKLIQGRVGVDHLVIGAPVKLKASSAISNAGKGLNPNVFEIVEMAITQDAISGFIVASPTDVLMPGDEVPMPRQGQIVFVMPLGCGADLYLPCDASVAESTAINGPFTWDTTAHLLKKADSSSVGNLHLTIKSNVVDGLKYTTDTGGKAVMAKTKCIRVTL